MLDESSTTKNKSLGFSSHLTEEQKERQRLIFIGVIYIEKVQPAYESKVCNIYTFTSGKDRFTPKSML